MGPSARGGHVVNWKRVLERGDENWVQNMGPSARGGHVVNWERVLERGVVDRVLKIGSKI